MRYSARGVRCAILCRLFEHLQETYGIDWSKEVFVDGQLSLHQIDALLAFKHDGVIDELRSALQRLDEGTYGVCIRCKRLISGDLLAQDPTRRICARCEGAFNLPAPQHRPASAHH